MDFMTLFFLRIQHTVKQITCCEAKPRGTHTLYFVEIVVLLFGEQMRVSIFPGVDLSDEQRLEPAVRGTCEPSVV